MRQAQLRANFHNRVKTLVPGFPRADKMAEVYATDSHTCFKVRFH